MSELAGKSVIITGASRGIGAATARAMAAQGAKVLLTARTKAEIANQASAIRQSGGTALHLAVDVTDPVQVQAAVDLAVSEFGGLDVFVANAGTVDPIVRLENAQSDDWDRLIDINVKGVFHGIRSALPVMKSTGGGTIITIGSGAATSALEGWSAYCTSKAAVHHLNRVLHKEEADNGIRALVLSPGTVATDMQVAIRDSGVNPVSQLDWSSHISVDWVASALIWMCSADADDWRGSVVSLRDEDVRSRAGLID